MYFCCLEAFQNAGKYAGETASVHVKVWEQQGGLLVAKLGKGTYVYTGLAFFRQLPAGVPGAYRLFANLLGLKSPG